MPSAASERKAREWLDALQDRVVERSWKSEAAKARYRAAASPLFPSVWWTRTNEIASLAALLDSVRADLLNEIVGDELEEIRNHMVKGAIASVAGIASPLPTDAVLGRLLAMCAEREPVR